MFRLSLITILAALLFTPLPADDKPPQKPSRADRLKAIRDEYGKARDEFGKALRAGTIKLSTDGEHPAWDDMLKQHAKPARELIDADPADAVALEALLFCLGDLGAGASDPSLYQIVLKHHVASEKIDPLIRSQSAPVDFLRGVAAQSPHAKIRLWANYHLGENLYAAGKAGEAEPLLEALRRDTTAKGLSGYGSDTLADTAGRMLFEIQRLSVGQEIPEIAGPDLDGKSLKLLESRGKVTLVVFWATWCAPCMAMVPHERALAERYAGKPFVIVGVNGDLLTIENFKLIGPDGKVRDGTATVKAAIEKHKMTWRSFRNDKGGMPGNVSIAREWNVRSWPTLYLIDHRGIIRSKWKGHPGEKVLDSAVEKLVRNAEAEKEKSDK